MSSVTLASTDEIVAFFRASSTGNNRYQGHCPGPGHTHGDKNGSLSMEWYGSKWGLKCHAGCSFDTIVQACPDSIRRAVRGNAPKATLSVAPRRKKTAEHLYRLENGEPAYKICRYNTKPKCLPYTLQDGEWVKGMGDVEATLYRLPELREGIAAAADIFITEGEGDADALAALGFVATTNPFGAAKWETRFNAALADACCIYVLEDNDDAGRKRVRRLLLELAGARSAVYALRFQDMPEKGDVSDWLSALDSSTDKASAFRARVDHTRIPASDVQPLAQDELVEEESDEEIDDPRKRPPKMQGKKRATRDDYINFALSLPTFKDARRDVLSGSLCIQDGMFAGFPLWVPWDSGSFRGHLRGAAAEYGSFFQKDAFDDALTWYCVEKLTPQFLVDIPKWDGADRIGDIAQMVQLDNVSQDCFYDLVMMWGAGIFKKAQNPEFQNKCIVFQGSQGLGKDTLFKALTGGLGQYSSDLDIRKDEAILQLHQALVFHIPEFDRTSKSDIATLKHMLTTSSTNVREKYGRESRQRPVRASFCASGNLQDLLVDGTGNRRFWLFNLKYAGFKNGEPERKYPGSFSDPNYRKNQSQIVAQYKYVHDNPASFTPKSKSIEEMAEYIAEVQPENYEKTLSHEFNRKLLSVPSDLVVNGEEWWKADGLGDVFSALSRQFDRPEQTVKRMLGAARHRRKKGGVMFYRAVSIDI